ncbi:hypothetical protein EV1_015835 [Malus domestica]
MNTITMPLTNKNQQQPQLLITIKVVIMILINQQATNFKSQRIIVSTNLKMGKDVAVKLVPAAAVIVAFGFGAYVVKYYNK